MWISGFLTATAAVMWRNMRKLCGCIQCCSIVWFVTGNLWAEMMILHCYTLVEGATCCTRWREHCLSGFLWLVCGFVRHVVLEVPNDSTVSCTTLRKFRLSAETCFITIFRMMELHWCVVNMRTYNLYIEEQGVSSCEFQGSWRLPPQWCGGTWENSAAVSNVAALYDLWRAIYGPRWWFCIVTHSWREQHVAPDGVNIVLADFSDWSAALSDMLFWRFQMILQCHAPHWESSD